jgi:Uma2 family endonuclease
MRKSISNTPKTAVEVFKLLPEGIYCQVINNAIYMSPAPSFEHQDIVLEIASQIRIFISKKGLGKCVASPVDVFLDNFNAFQPDIIFLSAKNSTAEIKNGKVYGAPDLVIEVLSPGNAEDDKVKKRKIYESCGVKEYFIVQPSNKEVITYYLINGKFEQTAKIKGKLVSKLLKKSFRF